MRTLIMLLGLVVAIAGGVALAMGGFSYTENRQVFELGPLEARADVEERVDIPPLAGGAVMALGVGLLVFGATRKKGGGSA